MKITNNHNQPLPLDDGVILAAAGTDGSEREVKKLSDRDHRRYVSTGRIAIIEETAKPASKSSKKEEGEK